MQCSMLGSLTEKKNNEMLMTWTITKWHTVMMLTHRNSFRKPTFLADHTLVVRRIFMKFLICYSMCLPRAKRLSPKLPCAIEAFSLLLSASWWDHHYNIYWGAMENTKPRSSQITWMQIIILQPYVWFSFNFLRATMHTLHVPIQVTNGGGPNSLVG